MDQPPGGLRYGVDYGLGDRHECGVDCECGALAFLAPILGPLYYRLDGPPSPEPVFDIAKRRIALTEGLWYGCARAVVSTILRPIPVFDGPERDLPFEVALRVGDAEEGNTMEAQYATREAALAGHRWMVEYAQLLQRLRTRPVRRRYYRSRGRTFGSRRRAAWRDANRLVDLLELMFKERSDVDL